METDRLSDEEMLERNDENEMEVDRVEEEDVEDEEMLDENRSMSHEDDHELMRRKNVRPPRPKRMKRSGTHTSSGQSDEEEDEEDEEDEEEEEPRRELIRPAEPEHAPLSNVDKLINVGTEYQAVIDDAEKQKLKREKEEDRDESLWKTPEDIDDVLLLKYIGEATGRYRMPIDRALYILRNEKFDMDAAIVQVGKRKEIKDNWTTEESSLFANCFFHFGKKFKKIQVAMPHRSLSSIIQFYYDTKKKTTYKMTIDAQLYENDELDVLSDEIKKLDKKPAGLCENCRAKSDVLILNKAMSRHECRACLLYFRMMRVPRPSHNRTYQERRERVMCPEYMKKYVNDYVELTTLADGKAAERLGFPKREKVEEDDECMVINVDPLSVPSKMYIVETGPTGEPADSNTCRMTRDLDNADELMEKHRKSSSLSVPLIWREKATKSMEDFEALNEESRRRMVLVAESLNRVKTADILFWKKDMQQLRGRWELEMAQEEEPVAAAGSRSGKVRHDFNWTDEEKRDVVRCFHWYNDDFETIADVMGSKTQEQIRTFFKTNEEVILKSIELYRQAVTGKLNSISAC